MMNIFRHSYRGNKGFALTTTLLATSVLLILAIPYISRVGGEYRLMTKMHDSTVALNVAEAGIERAIWEIAHNSSTFNGWAHTGTSSTPQTWTINNSQFKDSSNNIVGYYDSSVSLPAGSKTYTVAVTAYVPNKTKIEGQKKVTVTYYSQGLFNFSNAIAANGLDPSGNPITGSIKMDGNKVYVDSYDSRVGPYNDPTQVDTKLSNIVTNGDIQLSAAIAHINGNAYYGGKINGGAKKSITGIVDKLQAPMVLDFPQEDLNMAKTVNNNSSIQLVDRGSNDEDYAPLDGNNNLSVQNNAVIKLPGGTYYFKSISMSSGTNTIQVGGKVTVYTDGMITTSGVANVNTVAVPGESYPLPVNLIIYSSYSSGGIDIDLRDVYYFYGAIYAPSSVVGLSGNIDQGCFNGAIVCKTIRLLDDASIHYDIALGNVPSNAENNRVTSWQEQ